jgi:hypothetical protein
MITGDGQPGAWPVASLDPVARLRALAAGLPGVSLEERQLASPLPQVWDFISDLERSIPSFDRSVASIRVLERNDTHLRIQAQSTWRSAFRPMRFEVDLEPQWCWMVSRPTLYVVGMAAVSRGDGTLFGHLEGFSIPWRPLRPLLRLSRLKHRRHIHSDLDGIERAVT